MEAEMSTRPWRRIVCVCNYADQWAFYLSFYLFLADSVLARSLLAELRVFETRPLGLRKTLLQAVIRGAAF